MAGSSDGVTFRIDRNPVDLLDTNTRKEEIYHVYDPRITKIGGVYYVVFAADTASGCRLGAARTSDLRSYEPLGLDPTPDMRNGVLFPELFGGRFLRLDRPNRVSLPGGGTTGDEIMLSQSEDLTNWTTVAPVLSGRPHYWDELVGPGPPPIKTRAGWLEIYHGVARHFDSCNIYQAGAVLLDLEDPSRVVARTRDNILEPRESYELVGQVPNVVFPTGMIAQNVDDGGFAEMNSPVYVYYGAADTCVSLAVSTVEDLIRACHE
jgi:beta-1,4-mannooligosaccharide/beta-1,4-mannosyl-N-acetylglucosamine phosphorylase